MAGVTFDFNATFGDDYLYFHEAYLTEERSNAETAEIVELLNLAPGTRVLDAPCGHGRIANRLATAGMEVVGVDNNPGFLDLARADAAWRGVDVDLRWGDLRGLPSMGRSTPCCAGSRRSVTSRTTTTDGSSPSSTVCWRPGAGCSSRRCTTTGSSATSRPTPMQR